MALVSPLTSHGRHIGITDDRELEVPSSGMMFAPSFMKIRQLYREIDMIEPEACISYKANEVSLSC